VELGYGSTTEKVRSIAATNMFAHSSGMITRLASDEGAGGPVRL